MLLDKNQLELIEADVRIAKITLFHLSDELIDHICCEVENQMRLGHPFEQAYALIKEQTGIKTLKKIQEDTRFLIDKNYRLMKTTMKITGTISLALIGMGTVLKIFHFPGAGICLVLGFALLCLVFFPAAVYLNYSEGTIKGRAPLNISILLGGIVLMLGILFKVMHWPFSNILLFSGWTIIIWIFLPILLFLKLKGAQTREEKRIYILGIVSLMIFELSTLFKIMHWPGTAPLLVTGSVLLIAVVLPWFTFMKYKKSEIKAGQFIFLVIVSMYAVVLTSLLSMHISSDMVSRFQNEESNASKIARYFEKKKNNLLASPSVADSLPTSLRAQSLSLIKEADALQNLIKSIRMDLIQTADKVDRETASEYQSNTELIRAKDDMETASTLLTETENAGPAYALKEKMETFRTHAIGSTTSGSALAREIGILLSTSTDTTEGAADWVQYNFRHSMLLSTITFLTMLEKNVAIVETKVSQQTSNSN